MPMSFAPHLVIDGRPHCTYVVSSYPITGAFLASVLKQPLCTLGCISYLVKVIANFLLWASFTPLSLSFFQLTTVCRNIECFIVFHAQSSLCLLPQAYLSMLSSWIIASVAGLPPPPKKRRRRKERSSILTADTQICLKDRTIFILENTISHLRVEGKTLKGWVGMMQKNAARNSYLFIITNEKEFSLWYKGTRP